MKHFDRLVMIAGASGVGKSAVTDALRAGRAPSVFEKLEIDDTSSWKFVCETHPQIETDRTFDRVFWEFNVNSLRTPGVDHGRLCDRCRRMIDASNTLTILTLWTTPENLRNRNFRKLARHLCRRFFHIRPIQKTGIRLKLHRFRRRHRLYSNPKELYSLYNEWLAICEQLHPSDHWIADTTEWPPRIIPREQLARDTCGQIEITGLPVEQGAMTPRHPGGTEDRVRI